MIFHIPIRLNTRKRKEMDLGFDLVAEIKT
jgi:hypothetical protein